MNDIQTLLNLSIAEIELVYRNDVHPNDRTKVTGSSMAYEVFMSVWDMDKIDLREEVKIILLDSACHCLGVSTISTGGISSVIADQRIVLSTALQARATSFIMGHNHPSGNLQPSRHDIKMTEMLCEGGLIIGIPLYDHLIVSKWGYNSMRDNGLMPS